MHSTPPSQRQASGLSPRDKPLPSPPIVQLHSSTSSTQSSHSLIDASDKPLRRSPTGLSNDKEEWPVLQPRRPSNTGTLRDLMRDSGNQLTQQATSGQQERYPVLGNITLRQVPGGDQLPVSRYSAQHKIPRKEASSPKVQKQLHEEGGSIVQKKPDEMEHQNTRKSIEDPFRDGIYNTDLTAPSKENVSSSKPSVSSSFIEPRQTRTSFLRARLSVGKTNKDGQSQVSGPNGVKFLDEPVAGTLQEDSRLAHKEFKGRRSITPPVMQSLRTKASKGSLASNRAPAKFVGGSRRPSHTHRPSSRGSLRDETPAPSLPQSSPPPPSRMAPTKPDSLDIGTDAMEEQGRPTTNQHVSSIPVSRKNTPNAATHGNDNASQTRYGKAKCIDVRKLSSKKEARNESSIYNDHSTQDLMIDLEGTPPPRPTVNRLVPFLIDSTDAHVLEAIEESPQHAYQTKRLSTNSPEYGPTLKISPSAERFIMGSNLRKGDRAAKQKPIQAFEGAKSKDGLKLRKSGASSISSAEKLPQRPSTSQGLTQLGSRKNLIDPAVREKKVKSADVSLISPKTRDRDSAKVMQQLHDPNNINISVRGSGTSTSTAPCFFDASEELSTSDGKFNSPDIGEEKKQTAPLEVSPLKIKACKEVPSSNGSSSVDLLDQPLEHLGREATYTDCTNPFQDSNIEAHDVAELPKAHTKGVVVAMLPATPQSSTYGKANAQSDTLPPRSSSRLAPPDWTDNKKSPSPPITAEKIPPPTPPKPTSFAHRQNELGIRRGYGSSQLDLKNPYPKHDSHRSSIARESYKSEASLKKGHGVLSNLKGLFHKRSLDNEPLRPRTNINTKTKPKVAVTSNGSPCGPYPAYPLFSDIHPLHRPTLASANRSKASTPVHKEPITHSSAATPSSASPLPTNVSTTSAMAMAMEILDAARTENTSPKKERLMKLGEVITATITLACDAQKAMEEAKQAARNAEQAYVSCQMGLGEVDRCVREWRGSRRSEGRL